MAVLAVGAVMLSGCTGDDEPTAAPTPSGSPPAPSPTVSPSSSGSASASASGSPSSSGAEVPAAAKARTEAGALAFLDFFVAEVNRGQTSPGSVDLSTLSDKDCIACKKLQGNLQEYVDNGWSVKQAPVVISNAALANAPNEERVIVNFTYKQLPVAYYKDGTEVGKLKATTTKNAAALRWGGAAWQIYDMEEL
ncbi:DUF6318 family protein [Knoellia sp. LjRoot47]|uniref:DUF6318 family protein n=1 Tax=Knoellia sp. LjRoot47 TaxID=3342330 RepID=UPI003F500A86